MIRISGQKFITVFGFPALILSISYIFNPITCLVATGIYITGLIVLIRILSDKGFDGIKYIFEIQSNREVKE